MNTLSSQSRSLNVSDAFIQGGIETDKACYLGCSLDIYKRSDFWNPLYSNKGTGYQFFLEKLSK